MLGKKLQLTLVTLGKVMLQLTHINNVTTLTHVALLGEKMLHVVIRS